MSVFRPFHSARGAIHYLDITGGLSDERTIPLLVSPQVLYVLQNLSALDVQMECRWAVAKAAGGYLRLTTDDTEYPLFLEVVDEIGRQLSERVAGMGTILNYREALVLESSEDNATAGTNTLTIEGPGPEEVWVIDKVYAINTVSPCSAITVWAGFSGNDVPIVSETSPAAGKRVTGQGPVHLSNAFEIKAVFEGCTAGDDLYFRIIGYIMDLVQA
jgi:hypothetical protein